VHTAILPVVGGTAVATLLELVTRTKPAAVLLLGESAAASAVTVERIAVNLRDYRIADNTGQQVIDEPVVAGGPAAYFATLPVRRIVEAVRSGGIPAELSMSAGTFLCNEVMFALLHRLAGKAGHGRHPVLAGFVHLPQLPAQAVDAPRGRSTMTVATSLSAVRVILDTLADQLSQPGGGSIAQEARPTRARRPRS
jgi:pyroglutamyl-peptidase